MGNDTTTVTVTNLSTTAISYVVTSGTPGQEPIAGSLPGRSYGIIEHEFSQKIAVTIGDEQVTVGPNGMVVYVPPGVSGLVGTFEFATPTPST
ncbi:MAG TPA: hypothetical protein VJ885_03040 [Thermoanaerobaculia bacterium]|jgi:hypothetical protein|nr:hypothetical protein [Thermoanaerobaculia bacterium]